MNKHNTELNKITKVLNDFNINEIGKTSRFCSRKRIIKPFALGMIGLASRRLKKQS